MSLNLNKSNWTRYSLGDVSHASRERIDPESGEVERYVAGEHMDTDDLRIHRWGDVGDGYLGPAFHRRFRPGQVLYGSRRTYLRKVAVAEFNGVTSNTTFVVETKDSSILLQEFLPFIMTSEPFHEFSIRESKGSVNPYVNWSDLAKYEFNLPPREEQKRLADLLWAVENESLAQMASQEAAKNALQMHAENLIWNTNEDMTELGTLLQHCKYGTSERSVEDASGASTPVLRIPNVVSGSLILKDLKYLPGNRNDTDAAAVSSGDLLVVRTNGNPAFVSRGCLVPELDQTFLAASYLLMLRTRTEVLLPEYLALVWETPTMKRRLSPYIRSSAGNYNLSAKSIQSQLIPLPNLVNQALVVSQVEKIAAALKTMSSSLDHVRQARTAISSEIFGGAH